MLDLLKQLINGLQVGSIYALVALGYTMVYGIVKLINFAPVSYTHLMGTMRLARRVRRFFCGHFPACCQGGRSDYRPYIHSK